MATENAGFSGLNLVEKSYLFDCMEFLAIGTLRADIVPSSTQSQ
jgi:hypothetical protein